MIICMKKLINTINEKNRYFLPIAKGIGAIMLVTAVSVISVHFLTGDSLSDYAAANPDKAYAGSSGADADTSATSNSETLDTSPGQIDITRNHDIPGQVDITHDHDTREQVDITHDHNTREEVDITRDYNTSVQIHFYDPDNTSAPDRTTYSEGFYYEPLNDEMIDYITGVSYPVEGADEISVDDLRYIGIRYNDFNGIIQAGEMIANKSIARDLTEIFSELYEAGYQLEKVVLIDNYGGDDTASMSANNTSCFNYRVVEGSTSLSKHAYGLAIDINPFYNPYIVFGAGEDGSDYISPAGSEIYADRTQDFPYKIGPDDLCYRLFKEHGFKWGGDWNSCKDYQHFQKAE